MPDTAGSHKSEHKYYEPCPKNKGDWIRSIHARVIRPSKHSRSLRVECYFQGAALKDQDYFHGILPREEINTMLKRDGDFVVRKSIKNGSSQMVLSVYWATQKHFLIGTDSTGKWRLEGPSFGSIPALIEYYMVTQTPLTELSGACITRPIGREKWQLYNGDITKEKQIGKGHFGEVWKGTLALEDGERVAVAIKSCSRNVNDQERKKFVAEARIMRNYDHPHIVRFIGIAAQRDPMLLVMELVTGGSLKDYLRKNKGDIGQDEKVRYCLDAARGMEYLESQKCIHRDLAARNCLLADDSTLKISDFGMSTENTVFRARQGKQIPLKWTAPEALQYGIYTTKSDVWSFGILMWEIFADGAAPYPGKVNKEAVKFVKAGGRMEAPLESPDAIVTLMEKCWLADHPSRPSFKEIRKSLERVRR